MPCLLLTSLLLLPYSHVRTYFVPFLKWGQKMHLCFCLFVLNYVQNMCIMVLWVVNFSMEGYKIR